NLGNVFFALGALLTPTLADILLRTIDFRRTLGIIAIVCLIPAALAAGFNPQANVQGNANLARTLDNSYIWLAGFVFLLYSPIEGTVAAWATTFLTNLGIGERRAALLLSGFWLTFLSARFLTFFLEHGQPLLPWVNYVLILVLGLASAVLLGHLAGAH